MTRNKYMKLAAAVTALLLTVTVLTACGSASAKSSASSSASASVSTETVAMESKFGGLFLTANDINIKDSDSYLEDWKSGDYTEITKATTIKEEGVYVVSGKISGQITVEAADDAKVQIVLNGAAITSDDGPAIYIKSGDKITISLPEGTENTLTASKVSTDDDVDGAIYSKADLVLNGTGSLKVTSSADGIHSTDDLRITGGTYAITASDDGLVGKDRLEIADGDFVIKAGAKGLKTTNEEDEDKGFLYIEGGTFDINAGDDGINVKTAAWITGGTLTIKSGDDGIHADETLTIDDGKIDVTESVEGLEAPEIVLNGGDIEVNSSDDGINAAGGQTADSSTQDGQSTDGQAPDGQGQDQDSQTESENSAQAVAMAATTGDSSEQQPQGAPDGQMPNGEKPSGEMPNGKHGGKHPDGERPEGMGPDGNGSGESGGWQGGHGGGGMHGGMGGFDNENSQGYLTINGGTIYINAEGDGLDANTEITQTGGDVVVEGPTKSGNGALDYGKSYNMTGGTLFAVGSSGMMQSISEGSKVPSLAARLNGSVGKGDTLTIRDSSGKEVFSYKLSKSIESVVYASADLSSGSSYSILNGSSEVGTANVN